MMFIRVGLISAVIPALVRAQACADEGYAYFPSPCDKCCDVSAGPEAGCYAPGYGPNENVWGCYDSAPGLITTIIYGEATTTYTQATEITYSAPPDGPDATSITYTAAPTSSAGDSCLTGYTTCGDACMHIENECCSSEGNNCPPGSHCAISAAGVHFCCPDGEVCEGIGLTCDSGEVACKDGCMPIGYECCATSGGHCPPDYYCYVREEDGDTRCCPDGEECNNPQRSTPAGTSYSASTQGVSGLGDFSSTPAGEGSTAPTTGLGLSTGFPAGEPSTTALPSTSSSFSPPVAVSSGPPGSGASTKMAGLMHWALQAVVGVFGMALWW